MKKHSLTLFFTLVFLSGNVWTQNLVPNGDFEIYSNCPSSFSQINFASGWVGVSGTPDYFNSCANVSSNMNVPDAGGCYQQDCCGGFGYVGIYTFTKFTTNWREDIQVKLIDTLISGHKYLARMFVNFRNCFNYSISTMGMLFTPTPINSGGTNFINVANPQVKSNIPLTDTLNWMLVQDTVYANGNELYLTIGNFSTDATSDTLNTHYNSSVESYYYIDGVSVIDVNTIGINELKSKNNNLSIYPNPASNSISLGGRDNSIFQNSSVTIQNKLGEIVLKIPFTDNISLSNLQEGCYFLQLTTKNGETFQSKFIKQ